MPTVNKFLARRRRCLAMAPQQLEKIESAPGNGMASEASSHKMWYTGAGRPGEAGIVDGRRRPRPARRALFPESGMAERSAVRARAYRSAQSFAPRGGGKPLKSQEAAKSDISCPNDFNSLRG